MGTKPAFGVVVCEQLKNQPFDFKKTTADLYQCLLFVSTVSQCGASVNFLYNLLILYICCIGTGSVV
jgi:hypothetical protein